MHAQFGVGIFRQEYAPPYSLQWLDGSGLIFEINQLVTNHALAIAALAMFEIFCPCVLTFCHINSKRSITQQSTIVDNNIYLNIMPCKQALTITQHL